MKALKLIVIALMISLANILQAQVSVNINISPPPPWGPVGYTEVQYYYLPDVEAYYDVHTSMFIYLSGGAWIHRVHLPHHYRNYDLYGGYKIVLNDYHGNSPYNHFNDHKMKYAKGYKGNPQKTIGQKPGKGNSKPNSGKKEYNGHRDNDGGNSNSGKKSNGNGGHRKK
ncbi:MAG: hypothetical protein A2033_19660 [Bacteroidetes bacterium GWA2_31_9]|nr:MAG: hypothetical protein A2033_19660 [Bacteroidetes bacterium GWA2_31_9]